MTEEQKELLEWKIKHSREVADRARERGDMETYHKLIGYIDRLQKRITGIAETLQWSVRERRQLFR